MVSGVGLGLVRISPHCLQRTSRNCPGRLCKRSTNPVMTMESSSSQPIGHGLSSSKTPGGISVDTELRVAVSGPGFDLRGLALSVIWCSKSCSNGGRDMVLAAQTVGNANHIEPCLGKLQATRLPCRRCAGDPAPLATIGVNDSFLSARQR